MEAEKIRSWKDLKMRNVVAYSGKFKESCSPSVFQMFLLAYPDLHKCFGHRDTWVALSVELLISARVTMSWLWN